MRENGNSTRSITSEHEKISTRAIAKSFAVSKTAVRKYLQLAIAFDTKTKAIINFLF